MPTCADLGFGSGSTGSSGSGGSSSGSGNTPRPAGSGADTLQDTSQPRGRTSGGGDDSDGCSVAQVGRGQAAGGLAFGSLIGAFAWLALRKRRGARV
jgi:hypothetical protein